MCSSVLNDNEFSWRGFIVDLNVQEMLPVFERLHLKATVTACGDDAANVHEARHHYRTIVTANEAHFIRYMLEHQKRDSGTRCQDCWGLLVVPASAIVRERLLPKVKNGIPANGQMIPGVPQPMPISAYRFIPMVPSEYGVSDAVPTVRRTPPSRWIGTGPCRKSAPAPHKPRRSESGMKNGAIIQTDVRDTDNGQQGLPRSALDLSARRRCRATERAVPGRRGLIPRPTTRNYAKPRFGPAKPN
jgi:hypothetical protein